MSELNGYLVDRDTPRVTRIRCAANNTERARIEVDGDGNVIEVWVEPTKFGQEAMQALTLVGLQGINMEVWRSASTLKARFG
jgi:hypothetical protein